MINSAIPIMIMAVEMRAFFLIEAEINKATESKEAPMILATKSVSAIGGITSFCIP